MKEILTLVRKDFLVDFRQKYLIAGIGLYIFATIYISYLAFNNVITPSTWNALLWIILLFGSLTGLGKSFSQEEHRAPYYYFLTSASKILVAKLIYQMAYQLVLVSLILLLFTTFLGNPVQNQSLFIVNLALGAFGIAVSFTLTSALSAKSDNQSTMMAVLSFPVIIPVLILAVTNSRKIVQGANIDAIFGNLTTLLSVNVIIIVLAFILFPYSWRN